MHDTLTMEDHVGYQSELLSNSNEMSNLVSIASNLEMFYHNIKSAGTVTRQTVKQITDMRPDVLSLEQYPINGFSSVPTHQHVEVTLEGLLQSSRDILIEVFKSFWQGLMTVMRWLGRVIGFTFQQEEKAKAVAKSDKAINESLESVIYATDRADRQSMLDTIAQYESQANELIASTMGSLTKDLHWSVLNADKMFHAYRAFSMDFEKIVKGVEDRLDKSTEYMRQAIYRGDPANTLIGQIDVTYGFVYYTNRAIIGDLIEPDATKLPSQQLPIAINMIRKMVEAAATGLTGKPMGYSDLNSPAFGMDALYIVKADRLRTVENRLKSKLATINPDKLNAGKFPLERGIVTHFSRLANLDRAEVNMIADYAIIASRYFAVGYSVQSTRLKFNLEKYNIALRKLAEANPEEAQRIRDKLDSRLKGARGLY